MDDMDLQEKIRGNDIRADLDQMIDKLKTMPVGLPLVWLYVWDVIKYSYEIMSEDDEETMANPDKTLDDVWNSLWTNPRFSLEFGVEQLDEEIRDWLIDEEFIISVDGEDK
jgi:hypothetical protein